MNTQLKDPAESIVAMIGQLAVLPREEALARVREVVAKHEQAPQAEPSDEEIDTLAAQHAHGGDSAEWLEFRLRGWRNFARALLARYRQPAAPHSDLERARQGLPPYNPSMPTEQDWQRITENGRKAWGGAQPAASAEPDGYPCRIIEADFETGSVILQMDGKFTVSAGAKMLCDAAPVAEQKADEVECGCVDIYPADSYGAGFIDALGHFPNCEAAEPFDDSQKADDARDALRRLVDEKFSSGNAIPVERITITRQEYAAIAQQRTSGGK